MASYTSSIQSISTLHANAAIEIGTLKLFYHFPNKNCDNGFLEIKMFRPSPRFQPLTLSFHSPKQLSFECQTVHELDLLLINNLNRTLRIRVDKMTRDDSLISIHKIILQCPEEQKSVNKKHLQLRLGPNDSVFIKLVIFGKMKGTANFSFLRFVEMKTTGGSALLEYNSFQLQIF